MNSNVKQNPRSRDTFVCSEENIVMPHTLSGGECLTNVLHDPNVPTAEVLNKHSRFTPEVDLQPKGSERAGVERYAKKRHPLADKRHDLPQIFNLQSGWISGLHSCSIKCSASQRPELIRHSPDQQLLADCNCGLAATAQETGCWLLLVKDLRGERISSSDTLVFEDLLVDNFEVSRGNGARLVKHDVSDLVASRDGVDLLDDHSNSRSNTPSDDKDHIASPKAEGQQMANTAMP